MLKERPVGAVGISDDQARAMLATAARCSSIEIVGNYDKDQLRRRYSLRERRDEKKPFSSLNFMLACFWGRFEREGLTRAERAEFLTRLVGEEVSSHSLEQRAPLLGLKRGR